MLTSDSSPAPCSEHAPDSDPRHEGCLCPGCPTPMLPASAQTVLVAAASPAQALEHEFTHSLRSGDFGASVFRPPRRG
ncbi:MAG: hypothetical protein GXP55_01435 [Deltaproteobacteria bacterium]|nr:hypothetical protein [Deltaproteobacteria bacterium]